LFEETMRRINDLESKGEWKKWKIKI
jgi:hypothetical protein